MKKGNKAFTFVEILFVVMIISLLSVSGVNYFNNFIDSKRIEKDLSFIDTKIKDLNKKVNDKEIYDYEMVFSGSKDYLLYKTNQIIKKAELILNLDPITKSFTMTTTQTSSGYWNISLYVDNKLNDEIFTEQTNVFTGKMDYAQSYDIKTKLVGQEFNLGVFYFSEDNLDDSGVFTNFIQANTKPDKTGSSSINFVLKNVNSKLQFYSGTTLWDSKEAYLFFEKGGFEKSIKVGNY
ncbi:MAG: type II secretion system protein [Candidatus Gracilibacteria bacterium]